MLNITFFYYGDICKLSNCFLKQGMRHVSQLVQQRISKKNISVRYHCGIPLYKNLKEIGKKTQNIIFNLIFISYQMNCIIAR